MRACVSVAFLFAACLGSLAHAEERPNLVFIIADDCTYLDMEIYGGQAKTPHLRQLANQGMQFSRCFQAAPMCSPTRHNILTGIYPVKSGAWPNHTRVYAGTPSIVHYLKPAGYRVALSGKKHVAPPESFPFEYSAEFGSADPHQPDAYPEIEKLLAESKQTGVPFCLFACSHEPHTPYTKGDPSAYPADSLTLPPSWVDTQATRRAYSKYLAEISFFDAQCGRLLKMLEEHELAANTLVMAVSEQGSAFPFAKWTCYEMGLASGMIVRWPGQVQPAARSDALVEYCDVAPTLLEAAGIPTPSQMDGRSFLPVLLGDDIEHKKYTFGIHTTRGIINGSKTFAIRACGTKTHRYIRNLHHEITFTNTVTKTGATKSLWKSWKTKAAAGDPHALEMTTRYQHRPPEELYDVVHDPHCLHNLIDDPSLQSLRAELGSELDRWMASQGDKGQATEAIAHLRRASYAPGRAKTDKNGVKKN